MRQADYSKERQAVAPRSGSSGGHAMNTTMTGRPKPSLPYPAFGRRGSSLLIRHGDAGFAAGLLLIVLLFLPPFIFLLWHLLDIGRVAADCCAVVSRAGGVDGSKGRALRRALVTTTGWRRRHVLAV